MGHPIKTDDFGRGTPISGNHHMYLDIPASSQMVSSKTRQLTIQIHDL